MEVPGQFIPPESAMLLQFQFYLDTPERRMEGETVLYGSTTLDQAIERAGKMLKARTFYFGKANLCIHGPRRPRHS